MAKAKHQKHPAAKTAKKSLRDDLELAAVHEPKARQLHLPAGKLFRFKRVKHPQKLPGAWSITKKTVRVLASRWRLFLGIAIVYAVLNIVFVRGFSAGADVASLKQQLGLGLSGNVGQLITGISVFTALLASSGNNADPTAGAYQVFFWVIASLAAIWAVRQTMAGKRVRTRDAYYKGMYPLIPFILVIIIILLQMLPLLIGGLLYALVTTTGIALLLLEKVLWGILCFLLAYISIYMVSSSIFALYIVTLPDMTPRKALKSARELVRYRRGQALRKVLFMPLLLGIVILLLVLPAIFFVPAVAPWLLFVLAMMALVAAHAYLYILYKELLA